MLKLSSSELEVDILDPATDLERCGSRYCVGGYIYQVNDPELGSLLSGPQYPKPEPDVFHGQGAPEQFVSVLGQDAALGAEVAVIGVGRVKRTGAVRPMFARHNPEVLSFLPWALEATTDALIFRCEDSLHGMGYRLTRAVSLSQRQLTSTTRIESTGTEPLPIEWFAHPFFPPCDDRMCCQLSLPITMPENSGYFLNAEGFVQQKAGPTWGSDWEAGHYQVLEFSPSGANLRALQRHPKVGQITVETSFPPAKLPIWSNDRTFSFEPYFIQALVPGASAEFSIRYEF